MAAPQAPPAQRRAISLAQMLDVSAAGGGPAAGCGAGGLPVAAAAGHFASVPVMVPQPAASPLPVGYVGLPLPRPGLEVLAKHVEQGAETLKQSQETLIAQNARVLSHDPKGCRLVQRALDEATTDEARAAIVGTLQGHVWEMIRCPHANHVLQKYIMTMKPTACQFIIDELLSQGKDGVAKAARDKYGCRIIQRMLEHFHLDQMASIIDQLLADSVMLSMHRFGTFVVQHLLEYGTAAQRTHVVLQLKQQILSLSRNNDACMVLEAALSHGSPEDQHVLVEALLKSHGSIAAMAHMRRGHTGAILVLELSDREELQTAMRQILEQESSLGVNRYGRLVLGALRQLCGEKGVLGGA